MANIILGFCMLFICGISFLLAYSAAKDNHEKLWFRLIELITAVLILFPAVFLASFLRG